MQLNKYIPALEWMPHYNGKLLKADLFAGLTVGILLIPQGMAYAMLAGLPPVHGLYASIVPLLVYALLGTSRRLSVGPVAMDSLLVAAGVGLLATSGTEQYIALATLTALMAGFMQLLLGVFRLGFLVNFLSRPVISGFTTAAAFIIGISQAKHLFRIDLPNGTGMFSTIGELAVHWRNTHLPTLLLGLAGMAIIILAKKSKRNLPGSLLAVVFGTLVAWLLGLHEQGVRITGSIPSGLPHFEIPQFTLQNVRDLLPLSLTISMIAIIEAVSVAKAMQARHPDQQLRPNQEFRALGMANIAGALFQAYSVTGGLSRTAVNEQAGAQTGMASIISAALVALTLMFLTPLFYYLPKAILASIILVAVVGLLDFKRARRYWRSNKGDFAMFCITFASTLLLGIKEGILAGVAMSLGWIIYRSTKPHYAILGKLPQSNQYRNIMRFPEAEQRPDLLILRFDAQLYFANAGYFKDTMERLVEERGRDLKVVILYATGINGIDSTGMDALRCVVDYCRNRGVALYLTGVIGPVRDALCLSDLNDIIGANKQFLNIRDAVEFFDSQSIDDKLELNCKRAMQTDVK